MKTLRYLLALLGLWTVAGLAQDQPTDDLDLIYIAFQSRKPFSGVGNIPVQDGYFVAIKFWLVDSSGIPDPNQPTALYATANLYNPTRTGLPPMVRVSFNGSKLLERIAPIGTTYSVKRPLEPGEDWVSWYVHLSESTVPEAMAFDNLTGGGPFSLSFPTAYKLVIPDRAVLAAADLSVVGSALDAARPTANDARIGIFPSRVPGSLREFVFLNSNVDPSRPSLTIPKDRTWAEGNGWDYGNHAGFAGISACNEQEMGFAGRSGTLKYVFRACTVVVKLVEFVVQRAP